MGWTQVTAANTGTVDGLGWCLRFTQTAYQSPIKYLSARAAWDGQRGRHTARPPKGVSVPIWFDHWGTYGSPAYYANWGHVALWLGNGQVLTSPLKNSQLLRWDPLKGIWVGRGVYASIEAMQRDLGGNPKYLGWSEYLNGRQVVRYVNSTAPKPPSPGQEEDEDVYYVETSSNGTKYAVSVLRNRKRALSSAEWSRIRSAGRVGLPVPLIRISESDLKTIPNA